MCDPNAAQVILAFAVGGVTLRIATQWLKKILKVQGMLAQLLSIATPFAASAIFVLVTGGDWSCLLNIGLEVYLGMQVFHQAVKKK